jgi:hypothetical protein
LRNAALPLLALVGALTVSSHAGWGQAKQATLEGTWNITATPMNVTFPPNGGPVPPPSQNLATFTSNGGFITTGAGGPGVGQGSWVQTGDHTFNLTFVIFLYDSKGQFMGTEKAWNAITVNDTFDAQSGPVKIEVRDPTGKLVLAGTGSTQGTRQRAEPLQ